MTRITDEAVDAALNVLFDHGHNGIKCYDPQSGLDATVRAALEAALPPLQGATPVATREQLAEVIDPDAFDAAKPKSKANAAVLHWAARRYMALQYADRLLAAGVVRGGAS